MAFFDFLRRNNAPQGPSPEEVRSAQIGVAVNGLNFPSLKTKAGTKITHENSLAISTVYACVSRIAQTVATLDVNVYRTNNADGSRTVASHPVAGVVSRMADSQTTAFNFWETIVSDSLLWGCGYAYIERSGSVTALVHLPANQISKTEVNGETVYVYLTYNKNRRQMVPTRRFTPSELVIVPAFRNLSPIDLHRENLGLAKAAQEFGATFFGSGGNLSGVLMTDKSLTKEQYDALSMGWQNKYHGSESQHATAILEHGLKYEKVGIPPDQAQFIATREMQSEEIARIFGVPGTLVGVDVQTTYNNMEQLNIMFAQYTIQPIVKRIENELNSKLFTQRERATLSIEFDMATLLRGDAQTRSNFFSTMIRDGVLSINEVRRIEGFNPVEGGDVHLINTNLLPLDRIEDYGEKLAGSEPESTVEVEDDADEDIDNIDGETVEE